MNGLIIQWGIHTRTSSGWIDVYFPIAFTSKPILIDVPAEHDNINSVIWKYFAIAIYTDHFRYNNNGQTAQHWVAIGY